MKNTRLLSIATLFLALALFFLVFFFLDAHSTDKELSSKVQVKASIYPFTYLAEQIGGEFVKVNTITPPGVEAHDFEPSAREIAQLVDADLMLMSGELEPWAETVKNQPEIADIIVELGHDAIDHIEGEHHHDPHLWLSPVLMQELAQQTTLALIAVDPAHQDGYLRNQDKVLQELKKLDQAYRDGLARCELDIFITSHEAFGYLAEEYGLEQAGIAGISPEEEPSFQNLAELTQLAREKNINYIFFEELISPALSQTLANEVGAQTLVLNPLESLTQDQLELGEYYISVMTENLHNLRLALKCQ